MNFSSNKPDARGTSKISQPTHGATLQRVKPPTAPPIYRPQPLPVCIQPKPAVAPLASTVPALASLQCARKKGGGGGGKRKGGGGGGGGKKRGAAGGKGGVGYTTTGLTYSKAEVSKAMADAGLKGVKGHRKGKRGSGESGQTKVENKKLNAQLRVNRGKAQEQKNKCRTFHKRKNVGQTCAWCGTTLSLSNLQDYLK